MRFLRIAAGLLALLFLTGCAGRAEDPGETELPQETALEELPEEPSAESSFMKAVLYYRSDEGYIVPVEKLIPWEEGIARACLACMTGSKENDAEARALGLSTVIPEGARIGLAIKEGVALLDISGVSFASAEAELDMLEAAVNTLIGFPTVDSVTVTLDGAGGITDHGVQLPVRAGAYRLNPEEGEVSASAGKFAATLWFPNGSGSLKVPVTRYTSTEPTVCSLVSALMAGTKLSGLRSCFPENTLLLGAAVENGVLTVNFSEDFKEVFEVDGLYELAKETLMLTLSERYELESVRVEVNGEAVGDRGPGE